MTDKFRRVFGSGKPVIAMVHFGALPGSPLYDASGGVEALIDGVSRDIDALQRAGFDAIMFGNENDRPYELSGSTESMAAMTAVVMAVKPKTMETERGLASHR